MIAYLKGEIIHGEKDKIILLTSSGIGYEVYTLQPFEVSTQKKATVELFIYHLQKENITELYGFLRQEELAFFQLLLQVKGVGAKIAKNMMLHYSIESISLAISQQDVSFIQKIPGVGKKLSEQIILDLKGKITKPPGPSSISGVLYSELYEILESLGISRPQINQKIQKLSQLKDIGNLTKENIVKDLLLI